MSNYPNGFKNGLTVRGVPLTVSNPGKSFWVNNSTKLPDKGIGGSNGNDGSYLRPFSTIDYAIGQCKAGRGDKIFVMPSHAETISAAAGIALDVSGAALIGLGDGELRPILSLATATTATFKVTGANCSLHNFIFKCNIASLATCLQLQATDFYASNCEFREGTGSGLGFIEVGAADADSDRFCFDSCKFYSTGANQDHFIEILKDMVSGRVLNCEGDGDCDEGCIAIPAGGNACLDLQIKGGTYRNSQTNIAAISINGTSCTGVIQDVLLVTDTQASALDNGSLATDNVRWADETDQVASTPVLAPTDSVSNALGVNDADNAFSSSSVVANLDGSVLERLEALMDPLGGYDPLLGFRITKTSNLADGSGTDNLFTVTGRCLITHLSGEVTTVIGGAATMKLRDVTNSVDLCAATTIDTDAVGTMYSLPGLSAEILNGTGGTPVVGSVPNVTTPASRAGQIIGDVQAPLTIAHVLDAADTGAVAWVLYYKPLTSASSIVAAA